MASNPTAEWPATAAILQSLDFLVVQELFMTGTAELADVVLPAVSFAERDGTFTNFERRVQRYQKGVEPTGEALPDWRIISQLATQFDAGWPDFFTAHDVAAEIAKQVKPYKGFTYDKLRGEPVGWSTTAAGHHIFTGTSVLNTWYGQSWSTEAEARRPKYELLWHDLSPLPATGDGQVRLLLQRKLYDHGTMIRHSELLDLRRAHAVVALNPLDAGALEAVEGDIITVSTESAQVSLPLRVDSRVLPGTGVVVVGVDGVPLKSLAGQGSTRATLTRATPEFA
jgi:predicted molibdopterin-dependent oxidoreductase YjgC